MADKEKSAELILRLYELRREEVMRKARTWYFGFHPESVEDITAVARGEHSAYFRMVTSYWDMACSFVNHGAVDEEMFKDRKSGVEGKRGDLGGRRIIKKKKKKQSG